MRRAFDVAASSLSELEEVYCDKIKVLLLQKALSYRLTWNISMEE